MMDCWVLKMNLWCSIFILTLFHTLVAWCAAKHVTILPKMAGDADVQGTIRDLLHTGLYSHQHLDPSQLQVVTPVMVTYEGALLSHDLAHEHAHGHARARRDTNKHEHEHAPHQLHYNLTVDGREIRLDLRPSVTFMTPALVVERHTRLGRSRSAPAARATACHYTGSVRGQPDSRVAVSACDGLAGLLRTEHGEYWIEPSNQLPESSTAPRPHVIFKRSAVDKVQAYHRNKRDLNSRTNTNHRDLNSRTNTNHPSLNETEKRRSREYRLAMDKRRRDYLEQRRRRLEALRNNPTEYRRQQMRLRMEQRRLNTFRGNSVEASRSSEPSLEAKNRSQSKMSAERPRRIGRKHRRRKRSKNCATKQPPYQWRKQNSQSAARDRHWTNMNNRNPRRQYQMPPRRADRRRAPRSVSKPRHVEVLLVADKSMTDFHDKDNLETYLLTIMNMVSDLYMDRSIGNYIKVVVVKIILVEEMRAAPELEVSENADSTLASFCRWQHQLNPDNDDNPHHHDVAILVTRQDICSQHDVPCSTLGVAHVAGMCKPDRSCSVNEDNGIMLAHTITHELGHNFGLYHDTEKIGCHRRDGATLHIMTPIFEADTVLVAWSRCSKRDVTNFLDAGLGECLSDRPSQDEYVYPEVPAGVTFDAATQCHLQFGEEAMVCAKPSELCEHLWCLVNNTCKTMLRPAAPGTSCGDDMWCQNLTCVPRSPSPQPRDGGWGDWGEWSECSRTCGAGVSTKVRECDNPTPENNGKYCIGARSQYKICNTDPCSMNEPSFREVQCAKYNNLTHNNETINDWIPYFDQDKPCELQCIPKNGNDVEMIGGFVADGTPCRQNIGARDMCIAGVCYKVGCDWIVDSDVEQDTCGVCGGNGSECKTVQGIYTKGTTRQTGFSEVAVIPAGSRNVKIQEKVSPGNFLSIGSARTKKMYMSGAGNATLTEYFVAGAQAIYERDRDWEKVRISGPIAEDIKVYQRIIRGRHRNPGVTYQYSVDSARARPPRRYRLSEWSGCSARCGAGYARRHLQCVDERDRLVELSQCYHIEPPQHKALMKRCHAAACPPARASWWLGPWNPCTKPCHMPGEVVTKSRNVYCVEKQSNKLSPDSDCEHSTKPMTTLRCDVPAC